MGKRGPRPKPSGQKKLEGTFRADRAPKNEAQPKKVRNVNVKVPESIAMDDIASKYWRLYAPRLIRNGLFTELDSPALEGMCLAYSRALRADAEIRQNGLILKTEFGPRKNPAEPVSRNAWSEVRRFLALFGMSPSDRTRVEAEPIAPGSDGSAEGGDDNVDTSDEQFLFSKEDRKIAGHIGRR